MLEQYNEYIYIINYSIKSYNYRYNKYQNKTAEEPIPELVSIRLSDTIFLNDFIGRALKICSNYEKELDKSPTNPTFLALMESDLISHKNNISNYIKSM